MTRFSPATPKFGVDTFAEVIAVAPTRAMVSGLLPMKCGVHSAVARKTVPNPAAAPISWPMPLFQARALGSFRCRRLEKNRRTEARDQQLLLSQTW